MHVIGPICPVCKMPVPLSWRVGLRKSWGACPYCGIVLVERSSRKLICAFVSICLVCFIWWGAPWLRSILMRGLLALLCIMGAHLFMLGFVVRDQRRAGSTSRFS